MVLTLCTLGVVRCLVHLSTPKNVQWIHRDFSIPRVISPQYLEDHPRTWRSHLTQPWKTDHEIKVGWNFSFFPLNMKSPKVKRLARTAECATIYNLKAMFIAIWEGVPRYPILRGRFLTMVISLNFKPLTNWDGPPSILYVTQWSALIRWIPPQNTLQTSNTLVTYSIWVFPKIMVPPDDPF